MHIEEVNQNAIEILQLVWDVNRQTSCHAWFDYSGHVEVLDVRVGDREDEIIFRHHLNFDGTPSVIVLDPGKAEVVTVNYGIKRIKDELTRILESDEYAITYDEEPQSKSIKEQSDDVGISQADFI